LFPLDAMPPALESRYTRGRRFELAGESAVGLVVAGPGERHAAELSPAFVSRGLAHSFVRHRVGMFDLSDAVPAALALLTVAVFVAMIWAGNYRH
jgi:hypothetical protein